MSPSRLRLSRTSTVCHWAASRNCGLGLMSLVQPAWCLNGVDVRYDAVVQTCIVRVRLGRGK
jgi:hypothetical protein